MSTNISNDNLNQQLNQIRDLRSDNDKERKELNAKHLFIQSEIKATNLNIQELNELEVFIEKTHKKEIENAILFAVIVSAFVFAINMLFASSILTALNLVSVDFINKTALFSAITFLPSSAVATLIFFYNDVIMMKKYKSRLKHLKSLNLGEKINDLNNSLNNAKGLIKANVKENKKLEDQYMRLIKELSDAIDEKLSLSNEENENSKVKTLRKHPVILK